MKKGDLISIEFTGKKTSDGKIFDTTHEEKAKEAGIFDERKKYASMTVLVGSGELIKGLDDAIQTMKEGETKTIELEPKQAFGERNQELIKVVPLKEFKNHNVPAVPGTIVNANNMVGKVQSVSGGRVRIDFNHELAGRKVSFEIKIIKQFKEEKEKLHILCQKAFPQWANPIITKENQHVILKVPVQKLGQVQPVMAGFAKMVLDTIPETKKVLVQMEFEQKDFVAMEKESEHEHEYESDHEH